jgi:hypothetical protein
VLGGHQYPLSQSRRSALEEWRRGLAVARDQRNQVVDASDAAAGFNHDTLFEETLTASGADR